jgi:hypothetical protein
MGVFNFMETFFFISLGITFVLILLLVYHFKQRLGAIEQKSDTMFEIVNTMVREMSLIKSMVISQMRENPVHSTSYESPTNEAIVSEISLDGPTITRSEIVHAPNTLDDSDSEDLSDDDDSDDDESEDDKIVVSDDEEEETPLVKVVMLPKTESLDIGDTIEITEEFLEETEESEVESDTPLELNQDEPVLTVNKIEESEPVLIEHKPEEQEPEIKTLEDSKESEATNYNKLSLYNLKNLVVSRGLASDASKMKKPQLVQLLESADK